VARLAAISQLLFKCFADQRRMRSACRLPLRASYCPFLVQPVRAPLQPAQPQHTLHRQQAKAMTRLTAPSGCVIKLEQGDITEYKVRTSERWRTHCAWRMRCAARPGMPLRYSLEGMPLSVQCRWSRPVYAEQMRAWGLRTLPSLAAAAWSACTQHCSLRGTVRKPERSARAGRRKRELRERAHARQRPPASPQ
jgi:hypothetical protein